MPWEQILTWSFVVGLLTAGIRLAVPVLLAVLGEIISERSGVMNLGLEGVMLVGGLSGFIVAYQLEQAGISGADWFGLFAGLSGGAIMGLLMAVLAVRFKTDQVVTGVTLVLLGQGLTSFVFRKFSALSGARVKGLEAWAIPGLSKIPVIGDILFNHNAIVYLTVILVILCSVFLFRTNSGLALRAVGENPAAAETSGLNVDRIRTLAVMVGSAFAGFGGAVLTVVQLNIFTEGIIAGRGWIAIAIVFFSRWQPIWGLFGAVLFGVGDALQYRIQAFGLKDLPYEFLLMLPYVLTLLVLLRGTVRSDTPAALGVPYSKGKR
ncbi:ABC transporter permease [Leptolyngbya sp. FACHB-17]|uniref:ABC transporter permease n=1 Tax=unclassified Leptolyngbya TaxID=2650499 RepID=UPI00168148D1|nr:ABC transporter permease [Leptolyngbya sp. FACHB-17]MBD2078581.1 ABC transporter permease [Leptolyngbya sp. FACHB-17]